MLLDHQGLPHLITDPVSPLSARSTMGEDLSSLMAEKDRKLFFFGESEARHNRATLTFTRPPGAQRGKLLLNAHNNFWFDGLFGRFMEKFGSFYPAWIRMAARQTREERWQKQIEQDIPLSVYLKTDKGWELVEHLPTVGPMAYRNIVVPVDLSKVAGNEITVRIQTGFLFWQLDYAAMDFSEPVNLEVKELPLESAVTEEGRSVHELISRDDDRYLEQLFIGARTEFTFSATPIPEGATRSLFLHAKGYYEHIREFEGLPDLAELKKFRNPGQFDAYSKQLYFELETSEERRATETAEPELTR